MSSDENRLRRWARRKAEARQGRGGAAPVIEEDAGKPPALSEQAEAAAALEPEPENPPAGVDLPDIDSLAADSDYTVFMKEGVPSALRRLALGKLWASDPVFNVIDEMVEYGEDYTDAAMIVEGMKSAWEPGRGYAKEEPPADEPAAGDEETVAADEGENTTAAETDSENAAGEVDADEVAEDEETDLG